MAWIYVIDTVVNVAYTALFGAGWFVVLAQSLNGSGSIGGNALENATGAGTIGDTAGFTDPEVNATRVEVIARPAPGMMPGQEAIAYHSSYGPLGTALFESGSVASLTVIGLLFIVRTYFCIIVMSYARGILRSYIARQSTQEYSQTDVSGLAENPFREGKAEGAGWQGKLGRLMLRFPTKRYWLGRDEFADEWTRATSGRFESGRGTGLRIKVPETGLGERERRARSGTGPSQPFAGKDKE